MAFRFSSPIGRATGASALLHAIGLAATLLLIGRASPELAPAGATIELRLVETQGSEPLVQAPLEPAPAFPERSAAAPSPEAPQPPPAPAAPVPASPPQVSLTGDGLANALASGPAVLPARVDARWHNREPVYPPEAAQRREAGAVLLLVHIAPDGAVVGIGLAQSSGFPQLDRAAQTAVETWHFLPAVHDGQPVASDMPLRVVFQLN